MTSRLDGCLKDVREQAEIGYDTITVEEQDWKRWKKEIKEEIGKIAGYEGIKKRPMANDLIVVAESTWRQVHEERDNARE